MSTHPLDRRRVRPFGRRRFEPRRVAISCAAILLVFAAAFGIGQMNRSGSSVVERTPPPLPGVATPVPAALASAPTIKLAVVRPPPPAPKHRAPARSSQPAAVTPTVTPAAPVTSTPTPAPTVTPPAAETPAPKPATPAPSAPQHSSGGSGSGSGTSFESSG